MSKYEEWYDYEDYDDDYEDKKNIYRLVYYEYEEKKSLHCEDFEDILSTMRRYNIYKKVTVIDKRDGTDVTEEFNKFLKEKGFAFKDEAEKEIPSAILEFLPIRNKCNYFTYKEKNFLKILSLAKSFFEEDGRFLWNYGYFMFAAVDKMEGYDYEVVLFTKKGLRDSPIYIIESVMLQENFYKKEEILAAIKTFSDNFESFKKDLSIISNEKEYNKMLKLSNTQNPPKPTKTPEKIQKERERKAAEKRAAEEKLRGEKLDYSIENIDYKGASFELLKFNYHNKEFVYATVELGAKIAEADDIGSDFEKSIIEFLEQEEFENMKKKIAEVPYWNRFMEYCNEHYIRNDTVFYGSGDFMFRHHGKHFSKIRLSYDGLMFGYMLAESDYSEEELKQIANNNRCNEILDKDRFYKMQNFMDEAHRHAEEFSQFCAENDIPNVIEEHKVERVFDFNDFIDDSYDDEWDEE